MKWILIILFIIISSTSVNSQHTAGHVGPSISLLNLENNIVASCIEHATTTGDRYYCIMSELYGLKQVMNIVRAGQTAGEKKKLNELLYKHEISEGSYDFVSIELEYKDYINKPDKK